MGPLLLAALVGAVDPASYGQVFGSQAAKQVRAAPRLNVHGNKVLLTEVYAALADLSADDVVDDDTAREVQQRLLTFLRKSGYELAEVQVRADPDGFDVTVDEGQLEKVVFRGRLTVQAVAFKLGLSLPHDVFNRPALEREMRELASALRIARVWYRLVPSEEVAHRGPQLEALPPIQGYDLVRPHHRYELHIFFAEEEWRTGLGADLRTGYHDGLEAGLNYQGRGLLLEDDRWRAAGSGGVGLRNRIGDRRLYAAFSRAFAEARWYTPPLFARARPFVWLRGEALSRQRRDLSIETYFNETAEGSANLDWEFGPDRHLSFGGGLRWRRLFGAQAAEGYQVPPIVTDAERLRPFALLHSEWVFDDGDDRWDRRHEAVGEVRYFFPLNAPAYGRVHARWQRVLPFGWHDLWLKARGDLSFGEVVFHDEVGVSGYHLRAVFGDEWVRNVASAHAEFRFSVTRDLFKVSLFHDAAVWGQLDRYTGKERLVLGNSFGPGFHALVEGMLQFDLYLAFGFASDGRFDAGVQALLLKVY